MWATVSSRSCFCWLYTASPSLGAKNIISLISVSTIRWCPCIESSLVLWPLQSLGRTLLAFALLHSVLQGQICLLLFGYCILNQELANIFYKEPDSKSFSLYRLYDLCCNYPILPLESGNEWGCVPIKLYSWALKLEFHIISLCHIIFFFIWFFSTIKNVKKIRTSLVVQRLRIRMPMHRTRVRCLVWEDRTCGGATEPVRRNYRAFYALQREANTVKLE